MRYYTFIDYITQAYLALVGLWVLLFHDDTVAYWPVWVVAHGIGLVLIHCLIMTRRLVGANRWVERLRAFYPMLLFPFLYCETGHLNRMIFNHYLDPWFIQWEARLFGTQPSLVWMDKMGWLWLSELFYLAYFSYYGMILGLGIVLYFRHPLHFRHYLSVLAFMMYVCFVCFLILPVAGPSGFYREELRPQFVTAALADAEPPAYPNTVQSGPFYHLMSFIYRWLETPGAAFPSSHVAIAVGTLYFSYLYERRILVPHGIAVVLLGAATVYCRYHYVVDVVAGLIAAAVLLPLGNWLYRRIAECGVQSAELIQCPRTKDQ